MEGGGSRTEEEENRGKAKIMTKEGSTRMEKRLQRTREKERWRKHDIKEKRIERGRRD